MYRPAYSDEEDYKPLPITEGGTTRLKEMISSIRSKATAKRALFTTSLEIGPGLTIGVKGYSIYKRQEKSRSHFIHTGGEKARIVKGTTTYLGEITAQTVEKAQMRRAYKFGGEQIVFTAAEMKEMRNFGPPGMRIVGFKPEAAARFDRNMQPATFIYPDERDYIGSIRTFTALHAKLVRDAKVALVWAITRRNAAPQMGCLYPAVEVVDAASKQQVQPAGFFFIVLPFADDMRSNPEVLHVMAPSPLIDKMRDIVKMLHMPGGYVPDKYENPSLQWHYRILQAIALEEDKPENQPDKTLPKYKAINKHAGSLILEWGEELAKLSLDDSPEPAKPPKKVAKRAKEEDSDTEAKPRKKAAKPNVEGDEMKTIYNEGRLQKMTVPVLKEWLQSMSLDTKGKKADLIERCEKYFESH